MTDYTTCREHHHGPSRTPEQRLQVAVFERAVRDYLGGADLSASDGGGTVEVQDDDRRKAECYLFEPDYPAPPGFSAQDVADSLGWDLQAMRAGLKAMKAAAAEERTARPATRTSHEPRGLPPETPPPASRTSAGHPLVCRAPTSSGKRKGLCRMLKPKSVPTARRRVERQPC